MHALTTTVNLPPAAAPAGSLDHACGGSPGIACRLVWDISHSTYAADFTRAYLAGPVQLGLRIAFVLLIALLVRAATGRLISRVTRRAAARAEGGNGRVHTLLGDRRQQRAAALGSVLGNVASMTIFTIAAFIILGDLGLNLAPILASAGVIGIAIGFGAQNLVQDFLAGILMLLEDQYGVGDVIAIDNISGTVESVSLRLTRVRDVNGVIWHIRNGTISKSGNESHGWARAVVDFPVPHSLDIAEARALLEHTAVAMWQDEHWQDAILERPEVWGVQDITSDSVLVRVIARTAPQRQWEVGRELRERLTVALAVLVAAADGPGPLPEGTVSATGDAPAGGLGAVSPSTGSPSTGSPSTGSPSTGSPSTGGSGTGGSGTGG